MRCRQSALLVALLSTLTATSYAATENRSPVDPVSAITQDIEQKRTDIVAIDAVVAQEADALSELQQNSVILSRQYNDLETRLNRAKSELDKQYARLLEDPDVDLSSFQKRYQETWAQIKENQRLQLETKQKIAESELKVSQTKQKKARLYSELENLREAKVGARVKRINSELRESSVVETSYQTTCSSTMTLGECSNQGRHLNKQKAVNEFKTQLIAKLTETNLAKQHIEGVQLNIHIQESQFLTSGFTGSNGYYTELQAQLQAKPDTTAACTLLNVANRYCLNNSTQTKKNDKEWANITVRSDQYNDRVTINGVSYGSTPVEIVLPSGQHQISVAKEGYETYNRKVRVNGNDTIWVKLSPSKEG